MLDPETNDDKRKEERVCETCGRPYTLTDKDYDYVGPPYNDGNGSERCCLACWLGVGPKDSPESHDQEAL